MRSAAAARDQTMSEIVIQPKAGPPYTVKLDQVRTTVGRSSRNDVCLSDPFASRFHVEFRRDGEDFFAADVGSANGTLLNGKPLGKQTRLQPGDELRIGETSIRFARDGGAASVSQTSVFWSDAPPSQSGPEVTIASPLRI